MRSKRREVCAKFRAPRYTQRTMRVTKLLLTAASLDQAKDRLASAGGKTSGHGIEPSANQRSRR